MSLGEQALQGAVGRVRLLRYLSFTPLLKTHWASVPRPRVWKMDVNVWDGVSGKSEDVDRKVH